jgi:hypothetical protein
MEVQSYIPTDTDCALHQPCDSDAPERIDVEDADAVYLRGADVVGDIAHLLGSLLQSLADDEEEVEEHCAAVRLATLDTDIDVGDTAQAEAASDQPRRSQAIIEHPAPGSRHDASIDTRSVGEASDDVLLTMPGWTTTDTTASDPAPVTPSATSESAVQPFMSLESLKGNFFWSFNA